MGDFNNCYNFCWKFDKTINFLSQLRSNSQNMILWAQKLKFGEISNFQFLRGKNVQKLIIFCVFLYILAAFGPILKPFMGDKAKTQYFQTPTKFWITSACGGVQALELEISPKIEILQILSKSQKWWPISTIVATFVENSIKQPISSSNIEAILKISYYGLKI